MSSTPKTRFECLNEADFQKVHHFFVTWEIIGFENRHFSRENKHLNCLKTACDSSHKSLRKQFRCSLQWAKNYKLVTIYRFAKFHKPIFSFQIRPFSFLKKLHWVPFIWTVLLDGIPLTFAVLVVFICVKIKNKFDNQKHM